MTTETEAKPFPITPEMLTWFIRAGCVDRNELCRRMQIAPMTLRAWENGQQQPMRDEVALLAAILRRPTAAFLLPASYADDRADPYRLDSLRELDACQELAEDLIERIWNLRAGHAEPNESDGQSRVKP